MEKIRVKYRFAEDVDKLFNDGKLLADGFISREICRALRPLRKKGLLVVGSDPKLGTSVLVINGIKKKARKKMVGHSIFYFELL